MEETASPPPPPPPTAFPMSPKAYDGASRVVDAGACFEWLRQGWAGFVDNPGVWIGATALLLVVFMGLSIIPIIGQLAGHVLLPIMGAGLLHLCKRQADGEAPEITDVFIGLKQHTGGLVMVGVIYTAGVFGIAFLAFLLVTGGVLGGVVTGKVAGFGIALGGIMLAGLLVMVLSVPVIMATWFAPALVFFHNMPPIEAMKASFDACLKNWLPFTVYSILLVVMAFFAMLPLALGFLILVPVVTGALYASYRDIFPGV